MLSFYSLLLSPQFLIIYLLLALIAAVIGRSRATGFWLSFLIALIITPVITITLMMIFKSKTHRD